MITSHRQAFELYLRRQGEIEKLLFSLTRDEEATAEISQRVIEKLVGSCCNGRPIRNETGWVRTVARNTANDYFKEHQRRLGPLSPLGAESKTENPYHYLETYLETLVGFLPPKYAEPLHLDLFAGLPQKEIAERLGLSLSATKSRIQRARGLLLREIETCFILERGANGGLISACLRDNCQPLKDLEKKLA